MTRRKAAVSGFFYPDSDAGVREQIESFGVGEVVKEKAMGVISPHAGYRYSGPVAAMVFSRIENPGTILMIGPNHGSGAGAQAPGASIMTEGIWELPTGEAPIDAELAEALMETTPELTEAGWAHADEHSLEVQAPMLHVYCGDISIVPIIMGRIPDNKLSGIAAGIYATLKQWDKPFTLLASTDFSHYIPHEEAKKLDAKAIERIERLDAAGLIEVVRANHITMCGVQPTAIVIDVCRRLGAKNASLVKYRTSGESSGDYSSVVGYGGFVIQ